MLPAELQSSTREAVEQIVNSLNNSELALVQQKLGPLMLACAYSPWLQQIFVANPPRLVSWLQEGRFDRPVDPEALKTELTNATRHCDGQDEVKSRLRAVHLREEAIIAWRDLNGLASLTENLGHISLLAELVLTTALDWLTQALVCKHGTPIGELSHSPTQLTLLAMGKLGGRELNFHSDIDLIAIYGEAGATDGERSLSNQEFFTRLIRALIDLLQTPGPDGPLYNLDLRLRPFGDSGPLVVTAAALETYYTRNGREWERYALIKARPVGGDIQFGTRLLDELSPFIYRRYLDYGAFQSLRELKQEIDQQVRRSAEQFNVKLGRGGIREIEFIAQAFQLVHGGRDQSLRRPQLTSVLPLLHQRGEISQQEYQTLTAAYEFLRRSEHRIQMLHHQQHHRVPGDETDLLRLAGAMGYKHRHDYLDALAAVTDSVATLFANVLALDTESTPRNSSAEWSKLWKQPLQRDTALPLIEGLEFDDAETVFQQLLALQKSRNHLAASELAQQRLLMLLPGLLQACAEQPQADAALKGTLQLLDAILRRSAYLSLLYENPVALQRLCQLCAAGEWVTDWLCQHPVLLDELLDQRALTERPSKEHLAEQLDRALQQAGEDLEQQMNRLRDQRNGVILNAAMLDLAADSESGALLTEVAEVTLDRCLRLAWQQLAHRHGLPPQTGATDESATPGVLILGYGKLGAGDLSYRSDLDLVFLQPDCETEAKTDGPEATTVQRFYSRVVQRLVQLLSTQTTSGRLYEIDVRLRPDGNAGPIVSQIQSFRRYLWEQAQTWEHQALVHARPIAGDATLRAQFIELRRQLLCQPRQRQPLVAAVTEMRNRVREQKTITDIADQLKFNPGGMLDLEFFGQFLVLQYAADYPDLTRPTSTTELYSVAANLGLLDPALAQRLITAYQLLGNGRRRWELGQAVDPELLEGPQRLQIQKLIQQQMLP
ncbi:MAG: bifunctional [glutamate--ammonia ligase]-adenylyl-L-tyrosine phosphorylase/[glutamate--ammonia-ligase] adenylyltransferase [Gammaproteobacteria bacterium]